MSSQLTPSARQLLQRAKAGQMRAPAGMKKRVNSAVRSALETATKEPREAGRPVPGTQRGSAVRWLRKPWVSATLLTVGGLSWWCVAYVQRNADAHRSRFGRATTSSVVEQQPEHAAPAPKAARTRDADRAALSKETAAPDDLRAEMDWLARAEASLRKQDASAALQELGSGRERFAHGQLKAERDGLELIAKCMLGRDVSSELSRYIARTPDGVLVARARRACAPRGSNRR